MAFGERSIDRILLKKDQKGCEIVGVDTQNFHKNPNHDVWLNNTNFLEYGLEGNIGKFDLIISNPPFKHAQQMIEMSFDLLKEGGQIVALLRLAFLESQKRYSFFKENNPYEVSVFSKRSSFTGDGKAYPMAFAGFSWLKNYHGDTKLSWLN